MREIDCKRIISEIAKVCREMATDLDPNIADALKKYEQPQGVVSMMLKNIELAKSEKLPICQDTGTVVVFAEIGQEVHIVGGNFVEAVNSGVRAGYVNLRKSIVEDPLFDRVNTGDNTPAVLHTELVPGEFLQFTLLAKGGGAENKSTLRMFDPTASSIEIENFVVEWIRKTGAAACPPYIVGIGIGGNFEQAALLAKKSLALSLDEPNQNEDYAQMEKSILQKIQSLKIGPQGLEDEPTALAVKILTAPCHIASLPVAINLGCYVNRHSELTL